MELPYDLAILLWIYTEKELKAESLKRSGTPMFIIVLFITAKRIETTQVSINR